MNENRTIEEILAGKDEAKKELLEYFENMNKSINVQENELNK